MPLKHSGASINRIIRCSLDQGDGAKQLEPGRAQSQPFLYCDRLLHRLCSVYFLAKISFTRKGTHEGTCEWSKTPFVAFPEENILPVCRIEMYYNWVQRTSDTLLHSSVAFFMFLVLIRGRNRLMILPESRSTKSCHQQS